MQSRNTLRSINHRLGGYHQNLGPPSLRSLAKLLDLSIDILVSKTDTSGFTPNNFASVSLASLSQWKIDRAKMLSSQIAIKGYFAGEAAGIRLAHRASVYLFLPPDILT